MKRKHVLPPDFDPGDLIITQGVTEMPWEKLTKMPRLKGRWVRALYSSEGAASVVAAYLKKMYGLKRSIIFGKELYVQL